MGDQKSIGNYAVIQVCPICNNSKLHDFGDTYPRLGCEKCGRVWVHTDGMWVSEVRQVRIIREPKVGDSPDDFLEVVED